MGNSLIGTWGYIGDVDPNKPLSLLYSIDMERDDGEYIHVTVRIRPLSLNEVRF